MFNCNNEELEKMLQLIQKSVEFILLQTGVDKKVIRTVSFKLIKDNRDNIIDLLDMPYGGTLSPEEIAQSIVANNRNLISKYTDEAICLEEIAASTS